MDVRRVVERLAGGTAAADGVDLTVLSAEELKGFVVGVHAAIDRLRVVEARALQAADRQLAWVGSGARDVAGWLAETTNSSLADAARAARLGDALVAAPELADAVDDGRVSLGVAEAVAPTVTDPKLAAAAVDELLPQLSGVTPRRARRTADEWAASKRSSEDAAAQRSRAHAARFVRFNPATDGTVSGSFGLPTVDARAARQALEHLAGTPTEGDARSGEQRLADALVALCDAYAKGEVSGGRERPTALILVEDRVAEGNARGAGTTSFGDVVADADLCRILCDCELHRVVRRADSTILDFGRTTRTVSRSQWLALVARDRRCRWPGCKMPPGWCDAHHIEHWNHHGRTDLTNLALLCRHHHTTSHLPGYALGGTATQLTITLPDGSVLHSNLTGDQQPRTDQRPRTDQQQTALLPVAGGE